MERCARLYHTNKDAAEALGIRSDSFSALCLRDGLETPYKRRQREEARAVDPRLHDGRHAPSVERRVRRGALACQKETSPW